MKTYIFVLGIAVLGVVGASQFGSSTEVIKINKEEIEVNPNLHLLEDEDAVQAAKDVIRRKEAQLELNAVQGNIEALKSTYEAELGLLEAQEDELTEELSFQ